jgi:ubiquinone/menaquinone biosynthesis C-methylase UbiE
MRKYTAEKYINLVENTDDDILQSYMKAEIDVLSKVKDSKKKTFIDLGAGYGRVLRELAKIARNVILIEINPNMLEELRKRTKMYNASVIESDIQQLPKLLKSTDVKNPVLLLLQNTLGTIEGDYKKVLLGMKEVVQKQKGEIIISLFRQESLRNWGIKMYSKIREMVGEPDLQKTDFREGVFRSKTGYEAKWWSLKEIEKIKNYFGGVVVNEILTPHFVIIHISLIKNHENCCP